MSERAYTVRELDDLRSVVEMRYLYGTSNLNQCSGMSRSYREEEKTKAVEEMVRTAMLAGHTAQDIRDADNPAKGERG